jgi:transcriptional regulator with XRE-family HTH domain
MTSKKKGRSYYKIITEDQLAIRELRLEKGWSLTEASALLGIKSKGLGHIENGRVGLTDERVRQILNAWNIHYHDFIRAKKTVKDREKNRPLRKFVRTVLANKDRRSYQRIVTKEARVLKMLRLMKKLTQDNASSVCGYSRPSIGHIENGRIELSPSRIMHIVLSYGLEMDEFNRLMKEEVLRDEVLESCYAKMMGLAESKLKLIQSVLENL